MSPARKSKVIQWGVITTVLFTLASIVYGYGYINAEVKSTQSKTEEVKSDLQSYRAILWQAISELRAENKADHDRIQQMLLDLAKGK